jgi:hypothetical protein
VTDWTELTPTEELDPERPPLRYRRQSGTRPHTLNWLSGREIVLSDAEFEALVKAVQAQAEAA